MRLTPGSRVPRALQNIDMCPSHCLVRVRMVHTYTCRTHVHIETCLQVNITHTSLQEDSGKIMGPQTQEAIFRARETKRGGHTDAVDGNAWTWDTHTHTHS